MTFGSLLVLLALLGRSVLAQQCPWGRDPRFPSLWETCVCLQRGPDQMVNIQCQNTQFPDLINALQTFAQDSVIGTLLVNNTAEDINVLENFIFKNLKIMNLQITNSGVREVQERAFRGLENTLQNLDLSNNNLRSVPVSALRPLRLVSVLDLTNNGIRLVPNNAFVTLRLKTLKMAGNANLTFEPEAMNGLESSLKNLNLKEINLKRVPDAIRRLMGVAFLDLAQNKIRDIDPGTFQFMNSLTALNLERNVIRSLDPNVFLGATDSISSLSLLNNLITEYPLQAIQSLKDLRVLDLGFNLIRTLPVTAFRGIHHLTLLAVDGNPMATLDVETFKHLNESLRGLSLGGQFLTCDCNLQWIVEWIQKYDLQVTSRERNPQFCGNPQRLRGKNFYQLTMTDLSCGPPPTPPTPPTPPPSLRPIQTEQPVTTPKQRTERPMYQMSPALKPVVTAVPHGQRDRRPVTPIPTGMKSGDILTEIKMTVGQNSGPSRVPPPTTVSSDPRFPVLSQSLGAPSRDSPGQNVLEKVVMRPREPPGRVRDKSGDSEQPRLPPRPRTIGRLQRPTAIMPATPTATAGKAIVVTDPEKELAKEDLKIKSDLSETPREDNRVVTNKLPLLQENVKFKSSKSVSDDDEVIVRDAYKEDNSIVITWDSAVSNILGFRVVYRLFGKPEFKHGPPLAPSEREFRIKNVPVNECIVVCVVSLEEQRISPGSVPYEQCREIRTEGIGNDEKMDWIIIPASSAIVATVVIAVIIFIACLKSSHRSREAKVTSLLDEKPIHTLSMNGMGTLHGMHPSNPGPPLAGLAALGIGPSQKDWDQLSMYSQRTDRSVPRARMYHMDRAGSISGGYIPEDARSHLSALSAARSQRQSRSRSIGDLTGKASYMSGSGFGLGMSRQDLHHSRQSLVSHHSGAGLDAGELMMGRHSRASGLSRASVRRSVTSKAKKAMKRTAPRSQERGFGYRPHSSHRKHENDSLNDEEETEEEEEDDDDIDDEDEDQWANSTDNNWTDYDQDIYMHRNTTKFGGRPMQHHFQGPPPGMRGGMFARDDVNL